MAGRQYVLIAALWTASVSLLNAQGTLPTGTPETPQPAPSQRPPLRRQNTGEDGSRSPEFENVRRAIEALTPEQRRRFQENFARWSNLSPEEKKTLRDRDEMRRKRIAQETDQAIQQAGLQLDAERRELFAKRYAEERRKVEEQLRKETEERRAPRLKEIVGRLKEEFSTAAPQVAAPQGGATPEQNAARQ